MRGKIVPNATHGGVSPQAVVVARAHMTVMRNKSRADFALWWGPADRGMWGADFNYLRRYNPQFYSEADFRIRRRAIETMTGGVTSHTTGSQQQSFISRPTTMPARKASSAALLI